MTDQSQAKLTFFKKASALLIGQLAFLLFDAAGTIRLTARPLHAAAEHLSIEAHKRENMRSRSLASRAVQTRVSTNTFVGLIS